VSFLERLQEATKAHEATFAECYAEADGNERKAKRSLRRKLFSAYRSGPIVGLDPATIALIFALIKLAFEAWKWAKDNGYLKGYDYQAVPMQAMLLAAYNAGEFKETVEAPLLFEMFDDDDE
jgi:hypothetical protein